VRPGWRFATAADMYPVAGREARAADLGAGLPWPGEPMLCKSVDHLPLSRELTGGASFEPKFDGFRGIAGIDAAGNVQIRSRQNRDLTTAFADIAAAVAHQLPPGTLVDGELVVWNGQQLDFSQLLRRLASPAKAAALARARPASYVLFDVLQFAGEDLTGEPYRVRRRRLEAILPSLAPPLQIVPATRDRAVAEQWFADYAAADIGIEGLIAKSVTSRYAPGRRGAWLKYRSRNSQEAVIGAVTGTLAAPERLILGRPAADGVLVVVGATIALSPAQRLQVAAALRPMGAAHPWAPGVPSGGGGWGRANRRPVTRVQPELVIEFEADTSVSASGQFRHPVRLVRLRPELDVSDLPLMVAPPREASVPSGDSR
jgi:ATP-dependent DNA ligase